MIEQKKIVRWRWHRKSFAIGFVAVCTLITMWATPVRATAAETRPPLWSATVKPANGGLASGAAVDPSGSIVFVAGATDSQPFAFMVAAYDTATGARGWLQEYPCGVVATRRCVAATLAVSPDGSTLFLAGEVSTGWWIAKALDPSTGALLWTIRMPGGSPRWAPYGLSLVISLIGDRLFLAGSTTTEVGRPSEAIQALDTATGSALWRRAFAGSSYSDWPPFGISPDGSKVFSAVEGLRASLRIRGFDSASGTLIWKRSFGKAGREDRPTDLAVDPAGKRIYVTDYRTDVSGCCEIELPAVTLAYRTGTGTRVWKQVERLYSSNMDIQIAASTDRVFVTNGYGVQSRDARTGQALWRRTTVTLSGYWFDFEFRLAASSDGRRVFITEGLGLGDWPDRVETVGLNAATGRIRWTAIRKGICWGEITVAPDDTSVFVAGGLIGTADTYRGMLLLAYAA